MKSYKFFDVHLMAGEIRLWCTDPNILMRVVSDLGNIAPFSVAHEVTDLSNDLYPDQRSHYILNKFKDKHDAAYVWIIRQLCQAGWEPFATEIGTIEASRIVSLRLIIEDT